MRLHESQPMPGSRKRRKRIGCGESSGHGKTSCRGNKGQKARAGGAIRPGFEGGQMPLYRRLPKKGFSRGRFLDKVAEVNVSDLEANFEAGATINEEALREVRLVQGRVDFVKLLADGELTKKFTIQLDKVSASAEEKVEKAGGSVSTAS
jgi:large subunit ribosomal protein L15